VFETYGTHKNLELVISPLFLCVELWKVTELD